MGLPGIDEPRNIMEPAQILYELNRLGIAHRLHKGVFVTEASMYLNDPRNMSNGLVFALELHADALAELLPKYNPQMCHWCHTKIAHGKFFVRVYAQEEGRRYSFHQECHIDRRELHPNLPDAEILSEEPGYRVEIEDSGLCCMCMMAESELPEEAPILCRRCWKKQDAKKNRELAAA